MPITYLDCASTTPKPRVGDRRGHALLHRDGRQRASRRPSARRGVDRRRTSARATRSRRSSAPRRRRSCSRATRPSRSTWSRRASGSPRTTRWSSRPPSTTRTTCRGGSRPSPCSSTSTTKRCRATSSSKSALTPRTRLVTLAHVSNVTGVIAPVEEWIATAHAAGVPVMVDASQSISHLPIDVQEARLRLPRLLVAQDLRPLGRRRALRAQDRFETLKLWNVGGGMVNYHGEDRFEVREAPFRYEAGTPNIEGAIGLGAAIDYVRAVGLRQDRRAFARARRAARRRARVAAGRAGCSARTCRPSGASRLCTSRCRCRR